MPSQPLKTQTAAVQDARGDQCDACGKLLECTALINPRCKLTGTTPVLRATTHLYLDLPALSPQLQAYIDRSSRAGGWSSNCVQVALSQRAALILHSRKCTDLPRPVLRCVENSGNNKIQ